MKNKEISTALVAVTLAAVIAGILLSGLLVKGAKPVSVITVSSLPSNFPDVKNDSRYNSFLNPNAYDPTQVVPIGNSQNSSPFNGSQ